MVFETGHLNVRQKFVKSAGRFFGEKSTREMYDEKTSFVPFTVGNMQDYGPGEKFEDLPRPYREGYVEPPKDDGTVYDTQLTDKLQKFVEFAGAKSEPVQVGRASLKDKPVAVIYNPTSGKKTNIRAKIETKLT